MSQPFTKQNKTAFSHKTFFTSTTLNKIASTAPSEWGQKRMRENKKSIRLATLQYANCSTAICEWLTDLLHSFFSCLKRLFIYTLILPFKYTADGFSIGVSTNNILLESVCQNSFLKFAPLKCKTRKFILS